jgi:hypothetical protein
VRKIVLEMVVRGNSVLSQETEDVESFAAPFLNLEVATIVVCEKQHFVSGHR